MYNGLTTNLKRSYSPDDAYDEAMKQLEAAKNNMPTYDDRYEQSLQALYKEIAERPKFSYDPDGDALYQSYKRSYAQQGRLAMEDTMGQAAGLTGGYGSSYAQTVGQQQYGAYLQKLSDIYPETYGMAYRQYLDEGNALQERYAMLSEEAQTEYDRYRDRLGDYNRQLDDLQARADLAYDRGVAADKTAYDREQDSLNRQNAAFERLADMMLTMGYRPDADELAAAGMTQKQMEAYLQYYSSLHPVVSGGGRPAQTGEPFAYDYDSAMALAEKLLKKHDAETVNGEIARMVENEELDAETARAVITRVTARYYK